MLGIPADNQTIPADVLPKVRDQVVIDYLVDGSDTRKRVTMHVPLLLRIGSRIRRACVFAPSY